MATPDTPESKGATRGAVGKDVTTREDNPRTLVSTQDKFSLEVRICLPACWYLLLARDHVRSAPGLSRFDHVPARARWPELLMRCSPPMSGQVRSLVQHSAIGRITRAEDRELLIAEVHRRDQLLEIRAAPTDQVPP